MIVYKKVRLKADGNCYPLFIAKNKPFVFGSWMKCEFHPTKGFAERNIDDNEKTGGWHCCYQPIAPHLADKLASGEKRVWIECEAKGRTRKYNRPESQGGAWLLAEYIKPLRMLEA